MNVHRRAGLAVLTTAALASVVLGVPHVGKAAKAPRPGHAPATIGAVPPMMNYQGYLTSASQAPSEGAFAMTFRLFADSTGGSPLWTESYGSVSVLAGVFNVLLGSIQPLAIADFDGSRLWLETEVDQVVLLPRRPLVSVPYSLHAQVADVATVAANTRDTYHEIVDVMPHTAIRTFVAPRAPHPIVTLYLHGEGFAGTTLAHTHGGTNAHAHGFSATSAPASGDHSHAFSATTGPQSNDHSHSGSTAGVDLTHSHGGVDTDAGTHRHTLAVDGAPGNGIYLVASGNVNGLSASNTADRFLAGSVELDGSHRHGIANDLGTHSHGFGTGGSSANHSHAVSGTTAGASASHSHAVLGTTGNSGDGLSPTGVVGGVLPTAVRVYVDGNPAAVAGPFSGQFASGAIDLSAYVTDTAEHTIEIREEGGSGGRIVYTIFVEYTVSASGAALLSHAKGLVLQSTDSEDYFVIRVNDAGTLLPPERMRMYRAGRERRTD